MVPDGVMLNLLLVVICSIFAIGLFVYVAWRIASGREILSVEHAIAAFWVAVMVIIALRSNNTANSSTKSEPEREAGATATAEARSALQRATQTASPTISPGEAAIPPPPAPTKLPKATVTEARPAGEPTKTRPKPAGASTSTATRRKPTVTHSGESFRPFGPLYGGVYVTWKDQELTITPPANYDALYGAYLPISSCDSHIKFKARIEDFPETPLGYGYAVVPRSQIIGNVPHGWSVQFEYAGEQGDYFIRSVQLPQGAIYPSPSVSVLDLHEWRDVEVITIGARHTVRFDGRQVGVFPGPPRPNCQSLAIRVWGGIARFRDLTVSER